MTSQWGLEWVAEDSLMVRCLKPEHTQHLTALEAHCHRHYRAQLLDTVLAYDSLLLVFTTTAVSAPGFLAALTATLAATDGSVLPASPSRLHRLPICYDPEFALDLADISAHTGLSPQGIISAHQNTEYSVVAMGFSPGFAYCGTVPPCLTMPRKAHPRTQVPAGSVAIADHQTAIYPQASPGGWHILGRCPVALFDATQPIAQASLLHTGDRVRFFAIERAQFEHWV